MHDPATATASDDGQAEPPPTSDQSPWPTVLAGALFLTTGVALVVHVLTGLPLPLVLAAAVVVVGAVAALVQGDASLEWLRAHRRAIVVGIVAGVVSTAVYDLSRWTLVVVADLQGSPYAAFPFFGRAIVGAGAPDTLVDVVGTAFHFINGITFAIAYTIWFGRRRWWWGIVFALGLEAAMLAIYPGWLDVRALGEFTQISVLGHVWYGATLGGMVSWLRR